MSELPADRAERAVEPKEEDVLVLYVILAIGVIVSMLSFVAYIAARYTQKQ